MRWRIYYDDGTTCDSETRVDQVRGDGVIAIVQRDDALNDPYSTGRTFCMDRDYYCWRDREWIRVDLAGLLDYLRLPGWKKVLQGRTIDRATYKTVLGRALYDADFPAKSAYQEGEARVEALSR